MSVDEINIRFLVVIDLLSNCSENSHPLYTKFESNASLALFCKTTIACTLSVHCVHITRFIYNKHKMQFKK